MDEQRRSGDFAQPVRVEPHTEVGQIAAEYNRVLTAIGRRTDSLQLLQRTAAAAERVVLRRDRPRGRARRGLRVHRLARSATRCSSASDDPSLLVSTGVWQPRRRGALRAFRTRPKRAVPRRAAAWPASHSRSQKPVIASGTTTSRGRPADATSASCDRSATARPRSQWSMPLAERAGQDDSGSGSSSGSARASPSRSSRAPTTVGVLEFFSERAVPAEPGAARAAAQRRHATRARRRAPALGGGTAPRADRQHAGRRVPPRPRRPLHPRRTSSTRSSGGSATTRSAGRRSPRLTSSRCSSTTPSGRASQIDREVLETRRAEAGASRASAGRARSTCSRTCGSRCSNSSGADRGDRGHRHRHHGAETERGGAGRAARRVEMAGTRRWRRPRPRAGSSRT